MTLNFSLKFVSVFKVHACKDSFIVVRFFRETIETNYGNDSLLFPLSHEYSVSNSPKNADELR